MRIWDFALVREPAPPARLTLGERNPKSAFRNPKSLRGAAPTKVNGRRSIIDQVYEWEFGSSVQASQFSSCRHPCVAD